MKNMTSQRQQDKVVKKKNAVSVPNQSSRLGMIPRTIKDQLVYYYYHYDSAFLLLLRDSHFGAQDLDVG